eukprot:gene5734-10988_t
MVDSEKISSDSSTDPENTKKDAVSGPPLAKRKKKAQSFVHGWLQMCEFKGWLSKRVGKDGKLTSYCIPCGCDVTCSKTGIKRHARTTKHEENRLRSNVHKPLSTLWSNSTAKIIKLRVCAFLAEHALALSLAEPLVAVLRSLFPEDPSMKSVRLGKQKATNVIRQCLLGVPELPVGTAECFQSPVPERKTTAPLPKRGG